jgi:predicted Zn-dependent protease with MMP-like domain
LDSAVDLYPVPDGVYTLRFNVTIPQDDLADNSDTLQIPSEPVIQGTLARAISERGEDGGRLSNDQYILYRSAMADEIAIEAGRFSDETVWYPV